MITEAERYKKGDGGRGGGEGGERRRENGTEEEALHDHNIKETQKRVGPPVTPVE